MLREFALVPQLPSRRRMPKKYCKFAPNVFHEVMYLFLSNPKLKFPLMNIRMYALIAIVIA
jgi:hypothetical protein